MRHRDVEVRPARPVPVRGKLYIAVHVVDGRVADDMGVALAALVPVGRDGGIRIERGVVGGSHVQVPEEVLGAATVHVLVRIRPDAVAVGGIPVVGRAARVLVAGVAAAGPAPAPRPAGAVAGDVGAGVVGGVGR